MRVNLQFIYEKAEAGLGKVKKYLYYQQQIEQLTATLQEERKFNRRHEVDGLAFVLAALVHSKTETPNKALAEAKTKVEELLRAHGAPVVTDSALWKAFKDRGLIPGQSHGPN